MYTYPSHFFRNEPFMTTENAPIEPVERLLGFFDAPQMIQCRRCKTLKRAAVTHFRNVNRKTDRFRTTCRKCEKKSEYARSVNGKLAAIRNRPLLTEEERATLMIGDGTVLRPGVAEQVSEAKRERCRAARIKRFSADFELEWTEVRKVVAWRRDQLVLRIAQSKRRDRAGIAAAMEYSLNVRGYVNTLLSVYSAIVARMRKMAVWHSIIGDHLPPAHWRAAIKPPLSTHARIRVSPLELATAEERGLLRRLDPEKLNDYYWTEAVLLNADRVNGTLIYHVYPLLTPDGPIKLSETSPAWLKAFNGA